MTLDGRARSTVWLVGGLYVACMLLQRLAVPNQPIPLILPLVLAVAGWALLTGLLTFDRVRLIAWMVTTGVTAVAILVQSQLLERDLVSMSSWALFMVVWAPFTLHLVDRRLSTYLATLRAVVTASAVLAGVCVAMMTSQYAGLAYRDYVAEAVPSQFLLGGFVITYPIQYESPIYRANAWIGLEPSMVSLQMGVGLVAALLIGSRVTTILLLAGGLVAATSGSGFAVAAVALVVLLASSARRQLRRFLVPAVAFLAVGLATPMGQSISSRLTEGGQEQSSTSLRAILPYSYLWPTWSTDLSGVLLGFGPGSSQALVDQSGILGLLTPTPIKVFFEYGLLAGSVLAAMMVLAYVSGPSRAIAFSLFVSMWTLQPGTTTLLVLVPVLLLVTWWSPRLVPDALEEMFALTRARARPVAHASAAAGRAESAVPRAGGTPT